MGISASRERKNKLRITKENIKANKSEIDYLREVFDSHVERSSENEKKFMERFRKMSKELESKKVRNEELESKLNDMTSNLPSAQDLSAFDIEISKLRLERTNYELNLPNKIKELLNKERVKWNTDIAYIKEKYESQRQLGIQLTSNNLNQEKEIQDLRKKIEERVNIDEISKSCKCNYALVSRSSVMRMKLAVDEDSALDSIQRSEVEIKIDRLSQHIARVKDDLKVSEIKYATTRL